MTPNRRPLLLLATIAALSTSCGSNNPSTAAASASTSTGAMTTQAQIGKKALKVAVRSAIKANLQLSIYVLWHNRIPAWATRSTRGPALSALSAAAVTRRKQGIRIKNLSGHYTIVSIILAPSYATATAVIRDQRRVAPYKKGKPLGRAISGTEHARIHLRRLGNTRRFVVWRVSPVQ